MKILAFTDMHSSKKALDQIKKKSKDADVLVCCGDFTAFESGLKAIMKFLAGLKKDMILVHGNHEDEAHVAIEAKKYKNAHFIHKKSIKISGFEFIGYGGGGFALVDREFERFAKKFEKKKNIILVTHAPPNGTILDKLPFGHCGSKSISAFIKRGQPVLALSGHIHENELEKQNIGKTLILNPGPFGAMIEIK